MKKLPILGVFSLIDFSASCQDLKYYFLSTDCNNCYSVFKAYSQNIPKYFPVNIYLETKNYEDNKQYFLQKNRNDLNYRFFKSKKIGGSKLMLGKLLYEGQTLSDTKIISTEEILFDTTAYIGSGRFKSYSIDSQVVISNYRDGKVYLLSPNKSSLTDLNIGTENYNAIARNIVPNFSVAKNKKVLGMFGINSTQLEYAFTRKGNDFYVWKISHLAPTNSGGAISSSYVLKSSEGFKLFNDFEPECMTQLFEPAFLIVNDTSNVIHKFNYINKISSVLKTDADCYMLLDSTIFIYKSGKWSSIGKHFLKLSADPFKFFKYENQLFIVSFSKGKITLSFVDNLSIKEQYIAKIKFFDQISDFSIHDSVLYIILKNGYILKKEIF